MLVVLVIDLRFLIKSDSNHKKLKKARPIKSKKCLDLVKSVIMILIFKRKKFTEILIFSKRAQ